MRPEPSSPQPRASGPEPFFLGVNLPWLQYGCDFGANRWQPDGGVGRPDQRERLRRSFTKLSAQGLSVVRWFVLADGRAGLRFDARGTARGLDDLFWRDLEAGLEEADRARLALVPVLLDFAWCRRSRIVDGVRCGGHRRSVADPAARSVFLEGVVAPIVRRCRREGAVAAWDIVNEPEWVTWGSGTLNPLASVSRRTMRSFIRGVAGVIHAEAGQRATVGLASSRGLGLVGGLGLDVYQVHWYDRREWLAPLDRPVAGTLDRPVWLGEFPTAGSRKSPPEVVDSARRAGYSAAFAWSAEAVDPSTGPEDAH